MDRFKHFSNAIFLSVIVTQAVLSQTKKSDMELSDMELIVRLISKKRAFNKEYGYGYRIQLYNGSELQARRIYKTISKAYPKTKTYILYKQPEWKTQIGHYKTKLEADSAILQFKPKYPSAIVVPLGR